MNWYATLAALLLLSVGTASAQDTSQETGEDGQTTSEETGGEASTEPVSDVGLLTQAEIETLASQISKPAYGSIIWICLCHVSLYG